MNQDKVCTLRNDASFDGRFGFFNDLLQHLPLSLAHERHGAAHFPRASRSADPVHVMLHRVGHGEVYHLQTQTHSEILAFVARGITNIDENSQFSLPLYPDLWQRHPWPPKYRSVHP